MGLVLRISNRIYQKKQQVIVTEGIRAVGVVLELVVLEILLAGVSLPLYFSLKPQSVVAFFEEKGSYAKVSFDYNLRRVITLTGVSIILFIWLMKLLLILVVPTVFGPLKLYSVSELRPPDILAVDTQALTVEAGIPAASIVFDLAVPELTGIRKSNGQDYVFYGVGQSGSTVVLMLSGQQTAVYTEQVKSDGTWQIEHQQKEFKLNEGNHSVLVFTYDEANQTRSEFSNEQFFRVQTTFIDSLTRNVDVLANWSVVIFIVVGVFLTFLTI